MKAYQSYWPNGVSQNNRESVGSAAWFSVILFLLSVSLFSQSPIKIIYPREGQLLSAVDSSFIFGQVLISHKKLFINGVETRTSNDGAFIQFLPLAATQKDSSFNFRIEIQTRDSIVNFNRRVFVPIASVPLDRLEFDRRFTKPSSDVDLPIGEELEIQCRTIPGVNVVGFVMDSSGREEEILMNELRGMGMDNFGVAAFGTDHATAMPQVSGLYRGTYFLKREHSKKRIRFRVSYEGRSFEEISKGGISCGQTSVVIETTDLLNVARVAPGNSYYYFWPRDVRAFADGQTREEYRIRLNKNTSAWIPKNHVKIVSGRTVNSVVRVIRIRKEERNSLVKFTMAENLPFQISQPDDRTLVMKIFGATADIDWVRRENENDEIESARWSQLEDGIVQCTLRLSNSVWGYEAHYEGDNLVWKVRHKPKSAGLKNLKVCVDPGHGKDIGSTGPRGTQERQMNVEIASRLRKLLEKEGATVVMTHADTTDGLELLERTVIANSADCDIFVSVHNNALPDGINPFNQPYGPSVIYYHSQSQKLAEAILKTLVGKTNWPNFGSMEGNISVCRNGYMPSVLVECGFIMLPEQEEKLRDKKFQEKIAEGIRDGIKNFVNNKN